jgi:hypothetical protein
LFGTGSNGSVLSFCKYNGNIIAGGDFEGIGSTNANNIMELKNNSWVAMGSGIKPDNITFGGYTGKSHVSVMAVYKGSLFVAGLFDTVGGISVNNIAIWSEPAQQKVITSSVNENAMLYPNPNKRTFYINANNYPAGSYVEFYNMFGQQTGSYTLNAGGLSEINLQGKSVSGGIYLYRISSEDGDVLSSGRFIIL